MLFGNIFRNCINGMPGSIVELYAQQFELKPWHIVHCW
jgi:hypothetical protein